MALKNMKNTIAKQDFPKRLEIELTNACNSKCVSCPRRFGVGDEGFMDPGLFRKIIDESERHPDLILQLHRRGESLLHPNFIEMLGYVKGRFKELQLATNAILLTGETAEAISDNITFLSFSIDLPERYSKIRGVDVYKIVEQNILNFLKINRKMKVQVSLVKDETINESDIARFMGFWKDKVERVRIYEEHSIGGVYGAVRNKRPKREPCVKPFTDLVIYWNGDAVRCNHDWSNKPLGNASDISISEIWNGKELDNIRREQLSLEFSDGICKACDSWYPEESRQGTGIVYMRGN